MLFYFLKILEVNYNVEDDDNIRYIPWARRSANQTQ